ncbi:FtsK/SpoIIIE domain-containing protein [Candidatus Poriferisocius sp.]|uniref:FtsK/SpoIIIE domain-containing protein n=1 Tax=Candidatus Poriferisocius sp. TaxID=3101276 RepID=UPI003B0295C4
MRLLYDGPEGTREVSIAGGLMTDVGELAEVLGLPAPVTGLWVGDQWMEAGRGLDEAGVADGVRVGVRPGSAPDQPGWTLEVVGGLCAGERRPIPTKGLSLGRSPDADVTLLHVGLRPRHAHVEGRDGRFFALVGDNEPTALENTVPLRLGGVLIQASNALDDRPTRLAAIVGRTASGRIAFNRPPRPLPPPRPEALPTPGEEPRRSPRSFSFGWAALAGPLLIGVLMAVLYSPYMALFALLSPLMMGANWFDNRRRDRTERRRSRSRSQASLTEFQAAAEAAHGAETRRRRDQHPHLAEAIRRIRQPSVRLWERRPAHDDFLLLVAAHGPVPFDPELAIDGPQPAIEATAMLDQLGPIPDSPIAVDLGPGKLLGLVGPRRATTAIARSLLIQAVAHHGPADMAVLVAADEVSAPAWTWTAWLPHTTHSAVGRPRLIAEHRTAAAEIAGELAEAWDRRGEGHWPHLLVVADGESLATGRTPPLRSLLQGSAGPVSAIVLATSVDQLPATATAVVEAREASGSVDLSQTGESFCSVLASGMSLSLARDTARGLARYEDPEQHGANSGIPNHSSLFDLLGLPAADGSDPSADLLALSKAIASRWQDNGQADCLVAPIGADGHGPLTADLVADGPHALVGGTTGSGKSELLRTLVASLAASYSPERVNFVLVDYKGGSAFDACASLPHVVGLVTDLDDRLAERALRCLEAELRYREQVLRDRGATNLAHYWSLAQSENEGPWPPLARLIVVIDEFAALAAELPGFMDALVNVAQRGRSLGMHLVLATQRPSGAVSANIRTNTALRIALRVLDPADSTDVLDSPEAASIGRHQPGRAYARFGPGELVEFQCALITGVTAAKRGIRVVPAPDGIPNLEPTEDPEGEAPDDLSRLAAAAISAWDGWGGLPPRRPWPDPLPTTVSLNSLSAEAGPRVVFALADDPNQQTQCPLEWDPDQGNVIFAGNPGSGTTTALATLGISLAIRYPPADCHLYAIDSGSGQLAPLMALPHSGAVVGPDERDRIRRLVRRLEDELDQRLAQSRGSSDSTPPLVLTLVDNWGGLAKSLDNVADHALLASLERVWAEGPSVGLFVATAADQLSKVSRAVQAATPQTFVFRLGDPALYRQWGVSVEDPATLPPGRGFAVPSGIELQVAVPDGGLADAAAAVAAACPQSGGPSPVESLPSVVDPALLDQPRLEGSPWYLPLGLSDDALAAAGLTLYPGEHALILGPARSGRTSALSLLAQVGSEAGARVVAFAPGGSQLVNCAGIDLVAVDPPVLLTATSENDHPTLVLIDDAETVPDPDGTLKSLAADCRPGLHIVAAGRADRLRTAYGHWTAEVRFSRTGVLLQPTPLDGDLFTIQLPTRPTLPTIPGRGYLIQNGHPTIIQVAAARTEVTG